MMIGMIGGCDDIPNGIAVYCKSMSWRIKDLDGLSTLHKISNVMMPKRRVEHMLNLSVLIHYLKLHCHDSNLFLHVCSRVHHWTGIPIA